MNFLSAPMPMLLNLAIALAIVLTGCEGGSADHTQDGSPPGSEDAQRLDLSQHQDAAQRDSSSPTDMAPPLDMASSDTAPTRDMASLDADRSRDMKRGDGATPPDSTRPDVAPPDMSPPPAGQWLTANGWTNVAFPPVGGQVIIEFDIRALDAPVNAVAGIGLGVAQRYQDLAMLSRMNPAGFLDVRDGDGYAANVELPYAADQPYHVRIEADCDTHRYALWIAAPGAESILLRDAGFRLESIVDTVDHLTFFETESRLEVGNLTVNGVPIPMAVEAPPEPMGGLWAIDFQNSPLGNYTVARIEADWQGTRWASPNDRVTIEDEGGNRFARVQYPRGGVGPGEGGAQWWVDFQPFRHRTYDEFYVSYRIRFRPDFDFVLGGKLPGLLGGEGNTGGNTPDGRDGWSGRMMWRRAGAVVQYLYHPDQPGRYGEDLEWDRVFPTGQWVTVEHRIVINTPGQRDGVVQAWYNGVLAFDRRNIRFRDIPDFAVDGFYFSTFFGGSGDAWAPSRDEYIDFDDFVFSDRPITHRP